MLTDTLMEQGDQLSPARREPQLSIIHRAALGVAVTAGDLFALTDETAPDPWIVTFSARDLLETVAESVGSVTAARETEVVVRGPAGDVQADPSQVTRIMLGLTLRMASRIRDGRIELHAVRDAAGGVTFGVTAFGAHASPAGGEAELFEVLRPEPDTGSYTLSADGLGLSAAEQLIQYLGSELEVDASIPDELRLSFRVALA
jgi:hypothetical protein